MIVSDYEYTKLFDTPWKLSPKKSRCTQWRSRRNVHAANLLLSTIFLTQYLKSSFIPQSAVFTQVWNDSWRMYWVQEPLLMDFMKLFLILNGQVAPKKSQFIDRPSIPKLIKFSKFNPFVTCKIADKMLSFEHTQFYFQNCVIVSEFGVNKNFSACILNVMFLMDSSILCISNLKSMIIFFLQHITKRPSNFNRFMVYLIPNKRLYTKLWSQSMRTPLNIYWIYNQMKPQIF